MYEFAPFYLLKPSQIDHPSIGVAFFVPLPNRRTRKCHVGHYRGALRAPQANYRGPRPVTIIIARTMGTKVRLFGEKSKKLARKPKILQSRDDNLVRDLVRRQTVRVNDDMGGFFVDDFAGVGGERGTLKLEEWLFFLRRRIPFGM